MIHAVSNISLQRLLPLQNKQVSKCQGSPVSHCCLSTLHLVRQITCLRLKFCFCHSNQNHRVVNSVFMIFFLFPALHYVGFHLSLISSYRLWSFAVAFWPCSVMSSHNEDIKDFPERLHHQYNHRPTEVHV